MRFHVMQPDAPVTPLSWLWTVLKVGGGLTALVFAHAFPPLAFLAATLVASGAIRSVSVRIAWRAGYGQGRFDAVLTAAEAMRRGMTPEEWVDSELERQERCAVRVLNPHAKGTPPAP